MFYTTIQLLLTALAGKKTPTESNLLLGTKEVSRRRGTHVAAAVETHCIVGVLRYACAQHTTDSPNSGRAERPQQEGDGGSG